MIVPHLYLKGKCKEAIEHYKKAFGAEVKMLIPFPEEEKNKGVMHSEISIHGQRIMMNDFDYGPPTLLVIYDNIDDLKKSYEIMKEGSQTISPMQATSYTPCQVEFLDKYGVKWGFMVGQS